MSVRNCENILAASIADHPFGRSSTVQSHFANTKRRTMPATRGQGKYANMWSSQIAAQSKPHLLHMFACFPFLERLTGSFFCLAAR